jgi:hypothetical protein
VRKLTSALVLFSLLAGLLLTIWGLKHLQWPQDLPWSDKDTLVRYVSFLIICAALVFVGAWWSKRSALLVGAVVAGGFALLGGALWPLIVTLWFAIASVLMGKFILAVLRIRTEEDNWLTNFLVGAGIYGSAVGLIAHFPVSYPGVYGFALALPVILGWRVIIEESRKFLAQFNKNNNIEFGVNKFDVAIAVVALMYFVVALMPELGYDSLAMHLFIPSQLALRHQWGFDASTYVWAVMPMLGDWIFSIGYMLAGETAARLINVGFIFILGWLVRDLVLWAGGSVVGVRWAVLIFISTPLTFTEGSSLFIESVWASFVVAGTLAILSSCSTSGKPKFELPVAGFLLGCALAAKAVTFTILPVLLLLLVWRYRSWFKTAGLPLLALGLCLFLVMGSIPYVTAWCLTGNPVFPFFNHIFKSVYYSTGVTDFATVFGKGITWDFLYRATFQSGKYLEATNGVAGFQWLLLFFPALLAIFANRHRQGAALLFVGVMSIVVAFHSTSYLRYVFPTWAILAAAIGVAFDKVFTKQLVIKNFVYLVGVSAIALNLLFISSGAFYRDFALKPIVDESNRAFYLSGRLPIRNAVELINRVNTGRAPVAVFGNPLTAGLSGDALYPNWYNVKFQQEISSIQTDQDFANILLKRGVNFIILDSNWNGVNCCGGGKEKQAIIEKASEKIAEYGSLSVRKVKIDYRFKTELLNNPDFKSINGWALAPGAKYDADTGVISTNVASSATQVVSVASGQRYLNSVVARCAKDQTLGRVQINWLDIKGLFISTDIKTFECSPSWTEHVMEVATPPNAITAVVYVTGHTAIPLEFKGSSLLQ